MYYPDLHDICVQAGFKRKGSAYFRIVGDGVLQVVKPEYERALWGHILYIGFFSMYGDLLRQWFTSLGCIPRYAVMNCAAQNEMPIVFAPPISDQIELFRNSVIEWMNSVDTQKKLATAIRKLDSRWNDDLKIGPYLACGELNHAKKVVQSILEQHQFARFANASAGVYRSADTIKWEQDEDEELIRILDMIDRNDPQEINQYISNNFTRNMGYAKSIIK